MIAEKNRIAPERMQQLLTAMGLSQADGAILCNCSQTTMSHLCRGYEVKSLPISGVYNLSRIAENVIPFLLGDAVCINVNRRVVRQLLNTHRKMEMQK